MPPITVRRIESSPPPDPERVIYVGRHRIPFPHDEAPARQHLDFAALVVFSNLGQTSAYTVTPALLDAASTAGDAYFELYPGERVRAESLD